MAVVTVVPAESAIAGKRLTLIEQTKGCHETMAPFFVCFSRIRPQKKHQSNHSSAPLPPSLKPPLPRFLKFPSATRGASILRRTNLESRK